METKGETGEKTGEEAKETKSPVVEQLLANIRHKFDVGKDLLVISENHLEEAKRFDEEGWLNSISDSIYLFSNDFKYVSVVSTAYPF